MDFSKLQQELISDFNLTYEEQLILDDIVSSVIFEERTKFDCKQLITCTSDLMIYAEGELSYRNGVITWIDKPCVRSYTKDLKVANYHQIKHKNLDLAILKLMTL